MENCTEISLLFRCQGEWVNGKTLDSIREEGWGQKDTKDTQVEQFHGGVQITNWVTIGGSLTGQVRTNKRYLWTLDLGLGSWGYGLGAPFEFNFNFQFFIQSASQGRNYVIYVFIYLFGERQYRVSGVGGVGAQRPEPQGLVAIHLAVSVWGLKPLLAKWKMKWTNNKKKKIKSQKG